MKNLRVLERFYFVARYGGISRAARHMPYGVSQPALSSQLRQLEEELGCTLFQRHPFQLAPAGEKLFGCLRQFFENLQGILPGLSGPGPKLVRMASTPLVMRDYLPELLTRVRRRFPEVLFTMFEGSQREIDDWFDHREVDFMIRDGKVRERRASRP